MYYKYFLCALSLSLFQAQKVSSFQGPTEIGPPVPPANSVEAASAEASKSLEASSEASKGVLKISAEVNVTALLEACPQLTQCHLDDPQSALNCLLLVDLSVLQPGPCSDALAQGLVQKPSSRAFAGNSSDHYNYNYAYDNYNYDGNISDSYGYYDSSYDSGNASDYYYNYYNYEGSMPAMVIIEWDYGYDYGVTSSLPDMMEPMLDLMLAMLGFDALNLTQNDSLNSNQPLLPPRAQPGASAEEQNANNHQVQNVVS